MENNNNTTNTTTIELLSFQTIANKFRIIRRIGGGSFGEIYLGIATNNTKVI